MTSPKQFVIGLETDFPRLRNAPVVEAVIEIRARSTTPWEGERVRSSVEELLGGYQFLDFQREYHHEVKLQPGQPPNQEIRDLGLKGARFQSSDEKHIVQFNRDGFALSRLAPYIGWKQFSEEAFGKWPVFHTLARPVELDRIGLRFINRIKLPPETLTFEEYIDPSPEPPRGLDLPFHGFVHQDMLAVPEYPYALRVIRTIQPRSESLSAETAVIIDIDVFTIPDFRPSAENLEKHLLEMRWLKNKAFFGSITQRALEILQ